MDDTKPHIDPKERYAALYKAGRIYARRQISAAPDVIEEVVQEAMSKMVTASSQGTRDVWNTGYLWRTIQSVLADRGRDQERERKVLEAAQGARGSRPTDPLHAALASDLRRRMVARPRRERDRRWVDARLDGFSCSEIARSEDTSETTVANAVSRAKADIRDMLAAEEARDHLFRKSL